MIRTIALIAFCAAPAHADTSRAWEGSSASIIAGPGVPVATVLCVNRMTQGPGQLLDFPLSIGGFEVQISVFQEWGDVPDRYTVTPPEGYIAVPPFVDVPEGGEAVISIFSMEGVGA